MQVSQTQHQLHSRALDLSRKYKELEWQLIEVLQAIEQQKLYRSLGFPSLFQYSVEALGLSESVAYAFISVARKALQVEDLNKVLSDRTLSLAKASRLVSTINAENSESLIEFAKTHTCRAIDAEVARINPKAAKREKAKFIDAENVELNLTVSRETYEMLIRAQSLVSSQTGKPSNLAKVLEMALVGFLAKKDPLEKAKRFQHRKAQRVFISAGNPERLPSPNRQTNESLSTTVTRENAQSDRDVKKLCTYRVRKSRRVPLTAETKHAVNLRDGGRCTHVDGLGKRCQADRWLHVHHIRPVSEGGGNELSNLTTLCSFHHDLAHQLTLPLEGQVTWLRCPQVHYG